MASNDPSDESTFSRRTLLNTLGATSALSLAGCNLLGGGDGGDGGNGGDGGDGGGGELGERVPGMTMEYFSVLPTFEDSAPTLVQNLEGRLGLSVDAQPVQISTLVNSLYQDQRSTLMPLYTISYEIDPHVSINRFGADAAGSGIGRVGQNISNFVDCEYTVLANEQANFTGDDRRELVHRAQEIFSDQVPIVPTMTSPSISAWREDQINLGGIGPNNPSFSNVRSFTDTTTRGGTDVIHIAGTAFAYETINFLTLPDRGGPWNNVIHSPILQLTPDFEFENDLAESIDVQEDGNRVVVNLKSDATFHNGDDVTADDVKYTYELLLAGGEAGVYPGAPSLPLENIESVDSKTVAFNLTEPFAPLVEKEFWTWGILHEDTWEAVNALENPGEAEPDTPIVGSGPYQMDSFQLGESMYLEPYEDHHTYDPVAPIQVTVIENTQTQVQSLRGGEVNLVGSISVGHHNQLQDEDNIGLNAVANIQNEFLAPNMAVAPTKFPEFRKAVAAAIDRQELSAIAGGGLFPPEEYVTIYSQSHPYRAPEDRLYKMADSPTGSEEAARAHLSDEGWGWDNNGNLRYPADADLTPLWEAGETPDPSEFECLDENGYVRPDGFELPI